MQVGAFSVSLAVKDLQASKAFYQKLGFEATHGNEEHGYLIMKNGDHVIGLFQGMFEKNILTFNPGWDQQCGELKNFTDVRALQNQLRDQGVNIIKEAEGGEGPASFVIEDPDGNPILFDQHV